MDPRAGTLEEIRQRWQQNWDRARKVWSPFVKLREPIWCMSSHQAAAEGLSESFAAIRLNDHRILIDIEKVAKLGLQDFSLQVLAHEIGHHVYTPANLRDNAILFSRIRWSLADIEDRAPFVSNIYEDLLINDMLQRSKKLDMAAVYQQVNKDISFSEVWLLVMRTYEYLWKLKRGTLATALHLHSSKIDADASLMASLIRSYAKKWIDGGGRFAALFYPYLMEEKAYQDSRISLAILLDAELAGKDAGVIGGMAEIDKEAIAGAVDPRKEAFILKKEESGEENKTPDPGLGESLEGGKGPRQRYLHPGKYIDLLRQVNPAIEEQEVLSNYYREIALPHLVDFPLERASPVSMSLPEGLDTWDVSDPVDEIDWLETAIASPLLFPGFNTRKRLYGPDEEGGQDKKPLDVYVGIDCSGSMGNPRHRFSWPVLAAAIIGLSALRAGAKVMACLSGEPGGFIETKDFSSSEKEVLAVLTSYLGTGYAYGVPRLKSPFEKPLKPGAHIVLVTDDDIFSMLDAFTETGESNWHIIETALQHSGGIGTLVLHARGDWRQEEVKRLKQMGWHVYYVTNEQELLTFASEFSEAHYQRSTNT